MGRLLPSHRLPSEPSFHKQQAGATPGPPVLNWVDARTVYEGNGYVASEAYGINSDLVVFGLLYDKQERMFPFRWENGRMTVLKGPNGRIQQADVPDRTRSTNGGR